MNIITMISALLLGGVLAAPAIAANYLPNNNITKKVFKETSGATCEKEVRIYGNGSESRFRTSSDRNEVCSTTTFFVEKTASTFKHTGYQYPFFTSEYTTPVTFIQEDMSVGAKWSIEADQIIDGVAENTPTIFNLEVFDIVDVSTPAGDFTDCARLHYDSVDKTKDEDINFYYLWFCEDIGIVKWNVYYGDFGGSFELESIETDGTVYSGADYIQSKDITAKSFSEVLGGSSCNREERTFDGSTEQRVYSHTSSDNTNCYTFDIENYKTETSHTTMSQSFQNHDISYPNGIPVIVANMMIGETWGGNSVELLGEEMRAGRDDKFTLETVEDVTVPAGAYKECLKINWQSYSPTFKTDWDIDLWLCKGVGLVKYYREGINIIDQWEMTSIVKDSSDAGESADDGLEDSAGSGEDDSAGSEEDDSAGSEEDDSAGSEEDDSNGSDQDDSDEEKPDSDEAKESNASGGSTGSLIIPGLLFVILRRFNRISGSKCT